MMNFNHIKITLFLAFTCIYFNTHAQLATAPEPTLESPYNTVFVHLHFLQSDSYEPDIAAETIAPVLDSIARIEMAIQIKQLYDGNGLFVRLNMLPQEEAYQDSITDKPYYTPFPDKLPEVYLERIDGKWYYSRETITLVPELHNSLYPLGSDFLVKILPRKANAKILGLFVWQHVGFIIILLLCVLSYVFLSRIFKWIIHTLTRKRENWSFVDHSQGWTIARCTSIIVAAWLSRMLLPAIQLPVNGSDFANKTIDVVITIMFMAIGLTVVGILRKRAEPVTAGTESKMDEQLLPILSRIVKVIIIVIGTFYILHLLEVNVTALIAGISIGGLAMALAAKDTVQNLFGSAMIFIDRPFQIGDYIQAGGHEGTVVEVGFRSTRLMTIDTSIVSIPNGALTNMSLTNLGMRESRLCNLMLGVTYETPPDLIEAFIAGLRELIYAHPKTRNDPSYVYLREMADSSIGIMFRCSLLVPSYADEAIVKEEILFSILRLAEKMGVDFAYPTTTVHMVK